MPDSIEGPRACMCKPGTDLSTGNPVYTSQGRSTMQWIGIDVAKRSFTAAKRSGERFATQTFPMTQHGFQRFMRWCDDHQPRIALEPTGPY